MKTLKRLLGALGAIAVILVCLPFGVLLFGSESAAASVKMVFNAMFGYNIATPSATIIEQKFRAPKGFSIDVYAGNLQKIRFMRFSSAGDLLISRPRNGEIVLLERDADSNGQPDGQRVLLDGLTRPHGLDFYQGWLYVAESDGIGRIRFDAQRGLTEGKYQRVVDKLNDNGGHWTKTVRFGPDGWMYVAQGSSCNVCEEDDPRRATIMRFKPDGNAGEIYATGLRNSVGFDFAPWDNSLYATDNGRDMIGDDFPPCELNQIVEDGFYGWPYINGFGELDPDLGEGKSALLDKAISPAHGFGAHNAPLGMTFLRSARMPDGFKKAAIVALHGSWNRSERDGYKLVSLHWQKDGSIIEKDFLSGFMHGNTVVGRPVDVVEGPDGAIYVSDDYAGTVYRLSYTAQP